MLVSIIILQNITVFPETPCIQVNNWEFDYSYLDGTNTHNHLYFVFRYSLTLMKTLISVVFQRANAKRYQPANPRC